MIPYFSDAILAEHFGRPGADRRQTSYPVDLHLVHDFRDRLRASFGSQKGAERQISGKVPPHSADAQQAKKVSA